MTFHLDSRKKRNSAVSLKVFKYSLMIAVASSAMFQVIYGSILFVDPSFISTAFGFGDVTSNVPLLVVTKLYGKLFITVGFLSSLTVYMVLRERGLAVVSTLLIAVNMLVTGVVAYGMTKNVAFLYADLLRGAGLLALLYAYYYLYRRPKEHLRVGRQPSSSAYIATADSRSNPPPMTRAGFDAEVRHF
jgi:hypothetical protein